MSARKPYPSDVFDDEWALVSPYLTLRPEHVGQCEYSLREVFNGLRYVHQDRRTLALDAKRPAALGCRLSAGPALAGGRMLQGAGRGSPGGAAAGSRTQSGLAATLTRSLQSSVYLGPHPACLGS
jgi:hypothetical protein